MIAGYTGTQRRVTYTCVGDTVNIAARLESHTKVVGKPILIDECVYQAVKDQFDFDDEGMIALKGKVESVHVYSVRR